MKISMIAIGSRGDTQPYLALALGLQQAGHQLTICAGDNFAQMVTDYGLEFAPLGVDVQQFINVRIMEVLETGRNTFQAFRTVAREAMAHVDVMWEGIQRACASADVICTNMLGFGAVSLAEQRHIPLFLLHSTPMIGQTRTSPPMLSPIQRNLGGTFNLIQHQVIEFMVRQFLHMPFSKWRKSLGLKPQPRLGWRFDSMPDRLIPMLYAHSSDVLARPQDWPAHWHVTGYWFLDAPSDWQPPDDLAGFLDAGKPPVYIGFGSMANRSPGQMAQIAREALVRTGQRGIVATGWGGISNGLLSNDIFVVNSVPHDWLFPRMAAIVHHGGVGTTAAGFRSGVPSIVVPHFGDQFFWGESVYRLGVGSKPIPRKALTTDRLAEAIQRVTLDTELRRRAATLGEKIRREDGVGTAVALINGYLSGDLRMTHEER